MTNREIKFRGLTTEGKWLYGSLLSGLFVNIKEKKPTVEIIDASLCPEFDCLDDITNMGCEVVLETVGQLTGLKDKNGVEIYEGDILLGDFRNNNDDSPKFIVSFIKGSFRAAYFDKEDMAEYDTLADRLCVIMYDDSIEEPFDNWQQVSTMVFSENCKYEIIGNIHQHPNLLA